MEVVWALMAILSAFVTCKQVEFLHFLKCSKQLVHWPPEVAVVNAAALSDVAKIVVEHVKMS